MQKLYFLLFTIFIISCTVTHNLHQNKYPLNGDWVPIMQEMGGKPLPAMAVGHQLLTLRDTSYILTAESVDKGMVKYASGKMDIYGRDGVNAGKHFTAVYKLENEQLTICYNLMGEEYPAGYETKQHPLYFLSVFKRAPK